MEKTLKANLKIEVISYKESTLDKSVIYYIIEIIKRGSGKWVLEKRFSEFDTLHKLLSKLFGKTMPNLPSKTLIKPKLPHELELRRSELDRYLKELIVRQEIFNSEPLKKFLQIENFAPEVIVTPPLMIEEITNFIYGVRDFLYLPNESLFFALISDMNVLSRMDSYISNIKLPWDREDKPLCVSSVGVLECYYEKKKFSFEKLWSKSFAFQAICMNFNLNSGKIAVGLDDGTVFVGKVDKELNYLKIEELLMMKIHEARIMGIYLDEKTNVVYTVSEDKSLKITNIFDQKIIYDVIISYSMLTGMRVQTESKRMIVSNKNGNMFIYDIAESIPKILQTLQTPGNSTIRGLCLDPIKNLVFTGGINDGEICVFDIKIRGKEKLSKLEASFKSKSEVRVIEWSNLRGEIYAGHADGTITIWNGKSGNPIYVIKNSETAITNIKYLEKDRNLIVSSKSKNIKVWELPLFWRDKKIEEEEEMENKIRNKTEKMIDMQKKKIVCEQDSDEDELANFRF